MTKILDNFVKNIKKLDNYLILIEKDDHFVMGTEIIIKEQVEINGHLFMPYSHKRDKKIYTCFVLYLPKRDKISHQEMNHQYPKMPSIHITDAEMKYKLTKLKELLDGFARGDLV